MLSLGNKLYPWTFYYLLKGGEICLSIKVNKEHSVLIIQLGDHSL